MLVRIRPTLAPHAQKAITPSLAWYGRDIKGKGGAEVLEQVVRVTKGQTSFEGEFDGVLPPESSQARVYEEVRECIAHVLAGKHASVFACELCVSV